MLGFVNLDKPSGWTSHDCVARVRRILKTKRVGHGGTLDPMATGVLPIAVGNATRLLSYLPDKKAYRARIRFGMTTNTDDIEGEVIRSNPCPDLCLKTVETYLPRFSGSIEQIPPMFSAIQKDGKRLYELARKGEIIEVPPRIVEIYGITVLGWTEGEFPELEVSIECGGGTYIRSIARDLGDLVGVGGTLAGLIRTRSCGMELSDSITLETLAAADIHEILLPPRVALQGLEFLRLSPESSIDWFHGRKIALEGGEKGAFRAIESEDGKFLGIGQIAGDDESCYLQPKVVLAE
ncbi:tRNA pseudouridine(55) synthase TruB [Pannus brasiliensis CCIBt3594]|uniref:tRNA pseudouridine synthase B n=1 Tax=Pannus brasiliensis CCIBt3594 TaxID=1427578 RepID=A0AAW9QYZ2_9CHRO